MDVIKRKFEPNFAGIMYWRASSRIHHFILVALKTDHREYLSFWLANIQTKSSPVKELGLLEQTFQWYWTDMRFWFHSHKTFEYFLHTRTPTLFNQDRVFIWCSVLIGWYFFFKCEYKRPQAFYNRQSWCTILNKKDTFDGYYWNGFIFQIYTKW